MHINCVLNINLWAYMTVCLQENAFLFGFMGFSSCKKSPLHDIVLIIVQTLIWIDKQDQLKDNNLIRKKCIKRPRRATVN
jgi:hypothetical protein